MTEREGGERASESARMQAHRKTKGKKRKQREIAE